MQFTDAEFLSAKEKQQVLNAWKTFLKYGCKRQHFTKALYSHLIQHCSFIAHLNLDGFYATYFEQPSLTAKFFTQFDRSTGCRSVEYGAFWWWEDQRYRDLNEAMVDAAEPYLGHLYQRCRDLERDQDLAQAQALLQKHGITNPITG